MRRTNNEADVWFARHYATRTREYAEVDLHTGTELRLVVFEMYTKGSSMHQRKESWYFGCARCACTCEVAVAFHSSCGARAFATLPAEDVECVHLKEVLLQRRRRCE